MYTFIHPTKTGGTAVEGYFKTFYPNHIQGEGHGNKCTANNKPIIIVRDVRSRFISMYKYWKRGAGDTRFKRDAVFVRENENVTILDFIRLLKKNKRALCTGFTWDQHFANISKWIGKTDYKHIVVVRYKDNLNDSVHKLLAALDIPDRNITLHRVNVSKSANDEEKRLFESPEVSEFITEYFKDDIELINTVNNNPEAFKLVI
jgi:hypothetical protein